MKIGNFHIRTVIANSGLDTKKGVHGCEFKLTISFHSLGKSDGEVMDQNSQIWRTD